MGYGPYSDDCFEEANPLPAGHRRLCLNDRSDVDYKLLGGKCDGQLVAGGKINRVRFPRDLAPCGSCRRQFPTNEFILQPPCPSIITVIHGERPEDYAP